MQKITPFLWFDDQAEEAAKFYVSLFRNSKIKDISRCGEGRPCGEGHGRAIRARRSRSYSAQRRPTLQVHRSHFAYGQLPDPGRSRRVLGKAFGGRQEGPLWLAKDKYGLSWQIVPTVLGKLMSDPDREKANRVMKAMLQMDKLEIKGLQQAYQDKI